ncbi:MAG: hypothetical protein ACJASQ_000239 [Crocinitomicaceae bacterium]
MEGLNIYIKKVKDQDGSSLLGIIVLILLILLGLILVPILIVFWIFGTLYNLLIPNKTRHTPPSWTNISTNLNLSIKYNWASNESIPDYLEKYFDSYALMIFETDPKIEFFNAFFTNFKVERSDGIFIQRIEPNETNDGIEALPLYFFKYSTLEFEMID